MAVKTNERPGTRAVLRYSRMSSYKVREVLDLVRGMELSRALEILDHTERAAAEVVAKLVRSAAANAEHNEGIDPEELYIATAYADEGATLKRWRPRARGRATRIRKRTCHITVIVSRLPDERLARRRAEREAAGGQRSRRVSESRRRADLAGRLSRRRTAAAEAAAAEAEVEDELVEDAAMQQSAEDIVEGAEVELSDEEIEDTDEVDDQGDEDGDEVDEIEDSDDDDDDDDDDEKGK